MKIVVYLCCDDSQRRLGEQSIRLAWCDRAITPDEKVSMGNKDDWAIAQTTTYTNRSRGDIQQIEIVHVYRDVKPDKTEWEFLSYKDSHPSQAFEVQISEVGSNFIGWVAHISGKAPNLGEYVVSYGIKEDGSKTVRVEPWFTRELEVFTSDDADSAFATVYLTHHIIKSVESAVKEMAAA